MPSSQWWFIIDSWVLTAKFGALYYATVRSRLR